MSQEPGPSHDLPRPVSRMLTLFLVIASGLGWMMAITMTRLAVEDGIPYVAVAFWPNAISALLVGLYLLIRFKPVALSRTHLKLYAILALLGQVIAVLVIVYVSSRIPIGVLGLDVSLEPAFTYIFALGLALERFHRVRLLGLLLGLAGLLLILLPQAALPTRAMVPWVLLGLVAPISWAVLSVWIARVRPPEMDSAVLSFGLCAMAAIMLLPIMAITGDWWWFGTPFGLGEGMIIGIGITVGLTWIISFECIRLAGPVLYAAWGYVATPTGIFFGIWIFDEKPSGWIWGALVVIVAGLLLLNHTTAKARAVSQ